MSKETKFGYGVLLAGIGLPYLIDYFLGHSGKEVVYRNGTASPTGQRNNS